MKKLVFTLGILLAGLVGNAQQLTFSSQYMLNHYYTNPGAAGSTEYSPVAISFRQQWVGFNEAPRTQSFSFHTPIDGHHAAGFMLYNDVTGPLKRFSFQGTYTYHVEFSNNSHLGLGLSAMVNQHSLDGTTFNLNSTTDQVLTNGVAKSTNFDADFGVYYYTNDYYAGIAIPQLFQNKYKFGDNIEELNKQKRHYYFMGGYKFKIDEMWDIEPSFLMKTVAHAPVQFELTTRAHYNKMFWAGLSWRMKASVVLMAGVLYKDFAFGYSFDITTNNIRNYSSGTHELYLSYRISKKIREQSLSRF